MRLFLTIACLVLIGTGTLCFADRWTYFHAESVLSVTCKVQAVESHTNGSSESHPRWIATASAERSVDGRWEMMLGEYPPTSKGRHQAEKDCSRWMDEAGKRMRGGK